MQPRLSSKRHAAISLFEVGIVVAVVTILFAVLAPVLFQTRRISSGIYCTNNLKQIALAGKIWAGDNNDVYPMGISVTNGGALELVATGNVVATFLVMSNELSTPRILVCPQHLTSVGKHDFGGLANSNVSYFISADMTNDVNPQMIFAGDSDLMLGGKLLPPGLATLGTNAPVTWSGTRHPKSGNLALADGMVEITTAFRLRDYLQKTGLVTNRLALP